MKLALQKLAERLDLSPAELTATLRKTVFAGAKTDEEFASLLIVANTYGLNPVTKELYAFPAKGGGIVPIVSIDGWLRIINDHPQMDGLKVDLAADGSSCTVTIWRKDRSHPTVCTEFLAECQRQTDVWRQHPKRMLRHKTVIQAARMAFGFGGIHDEEDGKAVAEAIPEKPVAARVVDSASDQQAADEARKSMLRRSLREFAAQDGVPIGELVRIGKLNSLPTEIDGGREVLTLAALQAMVDGWSDLKLAEDVRPEDEDLM